MRTLGNFQQLSVAWGYPYRRRCDFHTYQSLASHSFYPLFVELPIRFGSSPPNAFFTRLQGIGRQHVVSSSVDASGSGAEEARPSILMCYYSCRFVSAHINAASDRLFYL
jgi:hypothetical protein